MDNIIKNDILVTLKETNRALEMKRFYELKEISDHVIHNSSIYQDSDSINTAILIYSLYKLLNSPKVVENELKRIIKDVKKAIKSLEEDDLKEFNFAYKDIYRDLNLAKDIKKNISFVVNQAKIKKGSRTVYHGISVERAADLFGISQWDLMNYLGKTDIYDTFEADVPVIKRLNYAREMLNSNNAK